MMTILKNEDKTMLCSDDISNNLSSNFVVKLIIGITLFLIVNGFFLVESAKTVGNERAVNFANMIVSCGSLFFGFWMCILKEEANLIENIQIINDEAISYPVIVTIIFRKTEDRDCFIIQFRHSELDKPIHSSVSNVSHNEAAAFFCFEEIMERTEKTMTLTYCKSEPKYYYLRTL